MLSPRRQKDAAREAPLGHIHIGKGMMDHFPYITIENTRYPTVILGGDRLTGIFGSPRHAHLENVITTPDYISAVFEACYHGFRGYDISMSDKVIACFTRLKEKYPDCIGIGNPNWNSGVMMGKKKFRHMLPRINAYLFTQFMYNSESMWNFT